MDSRCLLLVDMEFDREPAVCRMGLVFLFFKRDLDIEQFFYLR